MNTLRMKNRPYDPPYVTAAPPPLYYLGRRPVRPVIDVEADTLDSADNRDVGREQALALGTNAADMTRECFAAVWAVTKRGAYLLAALCATACVGIGAYVLRALHVDRGRAILLVDRIYGRKG